MEICQKMNAECKQMFEFIRESLKEIKDSQQRHLEGSHERADSINKLITDVEVIKANATNHLAHHTEIKQSFQWRTGIIVAVITFAVTLAVNLFLK